MNAGTKLSAYFRQFKARVGGPAWPRSAPGDEPPLRSELFSAEQMELHGKALAASHRLAPGRAPDQLPADWHAYKIHYRYRDTVYHIAVSQMRVGDDRESGVTRVTVDGVESSDKAIALVDDRQEHLVEVRVAAQ